MQARRTGGLGRGHHPAAFNEIEYSQPVLYKHLKPALFDAMFTRAAASRFAAADTPSELTAAFMQLRAAVETVANGRDVDTLAEVLWAALQGLITLDGGGRLRPEHQADRVDVLVAQLCALPGTPQSLPHRA